MDLVRVHLAGGHVRVIKIHCFSAKVFSCLRWRLELSLGPLCRLLSGSREVGRQARRLPEGGNAREKNDKAKGYLEASFAELPETEWNFLPANCEKSGHFGAEKVQQMQQVREARVHSNHLPSSAANYAIGEPAET